jgi:prepilin-type N-terminal cleavage/methylation domain-containing protein
MAFSPDHKLRPAARGRRRRRWRAPRGRAAFTLPELLVVVGIIAVLVALLVPAFAKIRRQARAAQCLSKLHQLAVGFQQYAMANNGRLPDPLAADVSWESALTPYLSGGEGAFTCPEDRELADSLGSSYDWRDTGDPATTLAGRSFADTRIPNPVLAFDSLPDWHSEGRMNAARLDGSTESMDSQACIKDIMTPLRGSATATGPAAGGP